MLNDHHAASLPKGLRLAPGDIVRHFKRETIGAPGSHYLYRILHFAIHSENGEPYVVYRALYGDCLIYVRPLSMFMSEVDHEKYPGIRQRWRFELADPGELPTDSDFLSLLDP
jgi:hypothetical protein